MLTILFLLIAISLMVASVALAEGTVPTRFVVLGTVTDCRPATVPYASASVAKYLQAKGASTITGELAEIAREKAGAPADLSQITREQAAAIAKAANADACIVSVQKAHGIWRAFVGVTAKGEGAIMVVDVDGKSLIDDTSEADKEPSAEQKAYRITEGVVGLTVATHAAHATHAAWTTGFARGVGWTLFAAALFIPGESRCHAEQRVIDKNTKAVLDRLISNLK